MGAPEVSIHVLQFLMEAKDSKKQRNTEKDEHKNENFISLRPEVETYIYDADHGFSCHHRKQYHQSSANLAQERVDEFLSRHIQNTN